MKKNKKTLNKPNSIKLPSALSKMKTIEEVHDYYQKIISCMPNNVYWLDSNCVTQGCNENVLRFLGLQHLEDFVGITYEIMGEIAGWKDGHANLYKQDDLEVMSSGVAKLGIQDPPLYDQEGNPTYYLSSRVPLFDDEHQEVIGVVGISVDITQQKLIENELKIAKEAAEAANKAKIEFIANIGHDIRTPLTGIIGYSQYLKDESKNLKVQQYAQQINESGEQLLALLNDVLDMIGVDSTNEDSVLQETFDLHALINDVLKLELPAIKARHLAIKIEVDKSIPHYVIGDRMKLHRVLLNLTGNAIKFTKKGHIEINAKLIDKGIETVTVEFEVKDTGIGIPIALQDKIFDRFVKGSPSYKGLYTGNGIGLHIAQKYVALLGGEIKCNSQEGVGTAFFFVLKLKIGHQNMIIAKRKSQPLASQSMNAAITAHKSADNQRIQQDSQLQVLLVEDNIPALHVLHMMFKPFDVRVTTAEDAETAFTFIQKNPFDLVITDIGLAKKSGDELANDIRILEKEQRRKPCTIIGLTGHSIGSIIQGCMDSGMNEVYLKPMRPEALNTIMERFIPAKSMLINAEDPESRSHLGLDLPDLEEDLFHLEHWPLLDIDTTLSLLGTESMAHEVFNSLITVGILPDLDIINKAFKEGDWPKVGVIAHKMKAGALYGTVRLHYALLYLERYQKAGNTKHLNMLYQQMLLVINETIDYLQIWLSVNKP